MLKTFTPNNNKDNSKQFLFYKGDLTHSMVKTLGYPSRIQIQGQPKIKQKWPITIKPYIIDNKKHIMNKPCTQ